MAENGIFFKKKVCTFQKYTYRFDDNMLLNHADNARWKYFIRNFYAYAYKLRYKLVERHNNCRIKVLEADLKVKR